MKGEPDSITYECTDAGLLVRCTITDPDLYERINSLSESDFAVVSRLFEAAVLARLLSELEVDE